MPPTLRTARLILSSPSASDHADLAAMWADPAVYEPLIGRPATREEAWHRLLRYIGHWQACGVGHLLARTPDGRFVGEVGIMDSRRATDPSFEGVPELGWAVAGWAQGQGYAREALGALLAWADARPIARTVCIIAPANAASTRLAERVGYRRYAEGTYGEKPTLFFERAAGGRRLDVATEKRGYG